MRDMIADFFIPLACDPGFGATARDWTADSSTYPWDTSVMKIIDNLIIGVRKSNGATETASPEPTDFP